MTPFGYDTNGRKHGAFPCPFAHCSGIGDVVDSRPVQGGIRRRRGSLALAGSETRGRRPR